ncbi:30S ribosomal protein S21 [Candidatus Woesearchaeota archaeon]|nr:30S ribosomal protein S21 [Candidatus Woesearchaeota archaeon]MBT6128830.1 30S ribosomal protein S21 [Candidatus Neomarinimicrobiota bacterium]MBT7556263.1 30S ribosomal protein S21 [Candidatus Woesearchaeota archaeon]
MIEVKVKNNNVEKALRIFKRKIKDSRILYDLSERSYYTKPSLKKRKMVLRAKARNLRDMQVENDKNF